MSFLANLFSKFSAQADEGYADKLFIVDATGFYEGPKKNGGRLSPRDQIDILQGLSRVASSENITVIAIFEGRPLKKVGHGKKFDELTVFFCDEASKLPDFILDQLKDWQRRKDVTVITSDRRLEERVLVTGGKAMRISTFKKAFETAASRRRKPRQNRRKSGGENSRGPKRKESPKPDEPDEDDVSSLIDLVD